MYNWKCQTGITAQPLWFTESVYLSKMTSFGPAAQTQISPPAGKHTIKLAHIYHLFSLHLEQIHACTLCIKCYRTAAAIAVHYNQHALKQQQVYLPFSALAPKLKRLVASINLVTPRIALFVEHLRCPCVVTLHPQLVMLKLNERMQQTKIQLTQFWTEIILTCIILVVATMLCNVQVTTRDDVLGEAAGESPLPDKSCTESTSNSSIASCTSCLLLTLSNRIFLWISTKQLKNRSFRITAV